MYVFKPPLRDSESGLVHRCCTSVCLSVCLSVCRYTRFNLKEVYLRRYESRRSSKPKLHLKKTKNKIWRITIFNMADGMLTPCNVAQSWHWFPQVTAPCNVAGGSGMTCYWIRPYVRHVGILYLFSISTISSPSTCLSAPVCKILSKSDIRHLGS